MHASIFSYNVTRAYPYRWLTPAVAVGGLIAIALASFLSVATQGYETVAIYLQEPNATDIGQTLFARWPSFLTANTKYLCSSTALPVNGEFYTNNTALSYKLSGIWQSDDASGPRSMAGSLPYDNQQLQNCSVGVIEINFSGLDRDGLQIARQQWGATLKAYASCVLPTQDGLVRLNLTTEYDLNPSTLWFGFPGRNSTSKASLWWGESLLAWYSIAATRDIDIANDKFTTNSDNLPVYKGYASFKPNKTEGYTADEIMSLDFFTPDCYFLPFSDRGTEFPIYWCNKQSITQLMSADDRDPGSPLRGIWRSSDSLAKAFYFTILADLGQQQATPNILSDTSLLEYFTKNISSISSADSVPYGENLDAEELGGLALEPFTTKDSSAALLGVGPSVISTTYLCRIPRLKSTSTLIVSVLINDIVILGALWRLFKFATESLLLRRHPEMNCCSACQGRKFAFRDEETADSTTEVTRLRDSKGSSSTSYAPVAQLDPR